MQNCAYTAQGTIICQKKASAQPVMQGWPSDNESVFEGFAQHNGAGSAHDLHQSMRFSKDFNKICDQEHCEVKPHQLSQCTGYKNGQRSVKGLSCPVTCTKCKCKGKKCYSMEAQLNIPKTGMRCLGFAKVGGKEHLQFVDDAKCEQEAVHQEEHYINFAPLAEQEQQPFYDQRMFRLMGQRS